LKGRGEARQKKTTRTGEGNMISGDQMGMVGGYGTGHDEKK